MGSSIALLDDGTGLIPADAAVKESGDGGNRWRRNRTLTPAYKRALLEATHLFRDAMAGDRHKMLDLQEAFSTSDFPILFGDILSRELLPEYQAIAPVWTQFVRRTVVRDFRSHKLVDLIGGQGLLEEVGELDEYPAGRLDEAMYEFKVRKFGKRFALSWESLINDDLGGLQNLPNRLAVGARRSEDYLAAALFVSATGPNPTFFSDTIQADPNQPNYHPYDNLWTGDSVVGETGGRPLTTDSLALALEEIQTRRDSDNAPILIDGFILMVPPSLELTAQKILNTTEIRVTDEAGNVLIMGNYLRGKVTPVVNPWLPVIDVSANSATTWYVLPVPSSPRPAGVLGFLRGHEVPDLRVKSSDSQRVGGGEVPASEGSFENDDIQYRVRAVNGGSGIDIAATLASTGDDTVAEADFPVEA